MAAGVNILVAGLVLASSAPRAQRLAGSLFLFSTGIYIIISADNPTALVGGHIHYLKYFAIFNTIFFWWFALCLFEEDVHLNRTMLIPLIVMALLYITAPYWLMRDSRLVVTVLSSIMNVCLMGHAIWLALRDRQDDLVDPSRRFRLAFALTVGVIGMMTAAAQNIDAFASLPKYFTLFHALTLLGVTLFFNAWFLAPKSAFLAALPKNARAQSPPPCEEQKPLPPKDRPVFKRLTTLMDNGAYREEGLTITKLSEKVGVPEHHLRRIINQGLGYRNFNAYLNGRRVEAAKATLSDPERAQEHIVQIALELGYGSLAPFNRAFKAATGKTPTEFRCASLSADETVETPTD